MKTGTVEKVEYTRGGAGNQWTTIDGVRYATYWDVLSKDWKVGDVVSFRESWNPLWSGSRSVPHADHIHKA